MTPTGTPDASNFAVFDRALVRTRRSRAARFFDAHSFLVERAATELLERLEGIERTFTAALDLGCHTGTARRLPEAKNLPQFAVSADLSQAMAAQAAAPRLVTDEERLPFKEESFDLVLSVLSLHWVNDLPGTLIQIRRSLRPDGLFLGAIFGGETLTELRQSFMEAESEIEGGVSPRISPFTDLRDGGALLQRAGLALPVTDSDRITVHYDHPLKLMAELRGMGETNALLERRRTPSHRATLMRACEIYRQRFGLEDGRVPATFEILYFAGWSPHESQQKPLRPGSAQARLADVLGVTEHKVKR